MGELDRFAEAGESVAREAGAFLMQRFRTGFHVGNKGEINLVTEIDVAAEELIISRLTDVFPDHAFLAEEKHADQQRGSHTWIIDPLDGTTNYAHGYPVFAVSIGLEIGGDLVWGAVYNPNLEEMFTARKGEGALLNGKPIRVSGEKDLGSSLLATGFPYDIRTSPDNNLDYFSAFALTSRAIRRAGSAALDLCYVAAGRFDGFWEIKLSPWDCAAGYLAIRESGGRVTDFRGEDGSITDKACVASNGHIHEAMLAVLREVNELQGKASLTTE